jgi:cytochrome c1
MKTFALASMLVFAACTAACSTSDRFEPATGGSAALGKATIERYGCAACHSIPGIRGFGGEVGPSLAHLASRPFIAGQLPNTPVNLVRWISDPHRVVQHTAMPTLGLSNKEARDVAAYLYSLD